LIDDIFSKSESVKTKKTGSFIWSKQYGTLAAAAVVLVVFAVSKFDINKTQENPDIQTQVPVVISNTETESQKSSESYIKARMVPGVSETVIGISETQKVTEEEAAEIANLLLGKLNSDENVFKTNPHSRDDNLFYGIIGAE
jgi:hypothetical protein